MKAVKISLLLFLILIVAIQFIRPERNHSDETSSSDISAAMAVPHDVKTVLENACYDCHSNNTAYPWYSNIQPVGWMLSKHIKEAKKELNFSEFGTYDQEKRSDKLKEIAHTIEDDEMPLSSYRIMHKNSRLTSQQKEMVTGWTSGAVNTVSEHN